MCRGDSLTVTQKAFLTKNKTEKKHEFGKSVSGLHLSSHIKTREVTLNLSVSPSRKSQKTSHRKIKKSTTVQIKDSLIIG